MVENTDRRHTGNSRTGTVSFPRSSGILLHPTSLPGPFGIGDFGPAAYEFADFAADPGQSIWQMLPLGPTGYGDSPYQCPSAFAGNPMLISLVRLVDEGLLAFNDVDDLPDFSAYDEPLMLGKGRNFRLPLHKIKSVSSRNSRRVNASGLPSTRCSARSKTNSAESHGQNGSAICAHANLEPCNAPAQNSPRRSPSRSSCSSLSFSNGTP